MKAPVEANDGDNSGVYTPKARHESTYSSCMELVMVQETKQMQGLTNDSINIVSGSDRHYVITLWLLLI